jgi:DNA-binding winged helix-turn-helix (wHTH) protein
MDAESGDGYGYRRGRIPNTLRIGLLGPLQVRDGTGHAVHVGGRQLRVLLILLALQAGRVVPAGSLAGQIWPEESPANPGNALQTLVSRLRTELRRASLDQVIESHPAGYRLAVRPEAVDALDFQVLAVRGSNEPILGHSAVRTRTTGCHQSRVVCAKCPQVAASAESILRPGRARQHRWVGRSR